MWNRNRSIFLLNVQEWNIQAIYSEIYFIKVDYLIQKHFVANRNDFFYIGDYEILLYRLLELKIKITEHQYETKDNGLKDKFINGEEYFISNGYLQWVPQQRGYFI